MRTHLSSVAEENKLFDGSGNVGVCENPQAGAGVRAIAGAGKKPVCVKAALSSSFLEYVMVMRTFVVAVISATNI